MMGSHIENPLRAALRASIFHCIQNSREPLTVGEISSALGEDDAREIARICYELRIKTGVIEFGEPRFVPAHGKLMKTYQAMTVDSEQAWAARAAASTAAAKTPAPKKTKKNAAQPAAAGHPWKHAVIPKPVRRPARITRDLQAHLQTPAPTAADAPPVVAHPDAPTAVMEPQSPGHAPQSAPSAPVIDTSRPIPGGIVLDDGRLIPRADDGTTFPLDQADIDLALIAALEAAAADLTPATDPATTEDQTMTEDRAFYGQDTDPGAPPAGLVWARQGASTAPAVYVPVPDPADIPDPATFVLTPETELAAPPVGAPLSAPSAPPTGCTGHCANHARASDLMDDLLDDLRPDRRDGDLLHEARMGILTAQRTYAAQALRHDPVWQALERAYQAAMGDQAEVGHG